MAYAVRHAGRVNERGELVLSDPVAWRAAVGKHRGRDVWVTVKRQSRAHSDNQRKYYHGCVVDMVAAHIGESNEEAHELMKADSAVLRKYARTIETLDGKSIRMAPSTKHLTAEQYAEYIDERKQWAASFLGLYIPDPGQVEVTL
jgi:hypothetical protein